MNELHRRVLFSASLIVAVLTAASPAYARVVASHSPPSSAQAGQPLTLTIQIHDNELQLSSSAQYDITLSYAVIDADGWVERMEVNATVSPLNSNVPQFFQLTIPGSDVRVPSITYSFQVREIRTVCSRLTCGTVYSYTSIGPYTVPVTN
jgi:hypothetical protein